MLFKMMWKDIIRNKTITVTLLIFMTLSTLLASSGANMITELTNSLNMLFTKSNAPHFVQMHAGEIDENDITAFTKTNDLVKEQQVVEMVQIDGANIYFGNNERAEKISLMDHYFVVQNEAFDLLLNLESEVIAVSKGEIAVPLYFMQQENLQIGDNIVISDQDFMIELSIVDFVRDVQMNPSIIHSKRFVVHKEDLTILKENLGEVEYSIEFLLKDLNTLDEFRNAYESAGLPAKGPNVDYHLFKILNGITDGIVAVVIIFISILISIIAILCIRYAILTGMEEEYKEIGIMKAIGIGLFDMKKMYLLKYIFLTVIGSLLGYGASIFLHQLFTTNIMTYIGTAPKSIFLHAIPFLAVLFIFFVILLFCMLTLRKFNNITAVSALQSSIRGETKIYHNGLALNKKKFFNVHLFLALKDVVARFKMYRLLLLVFMICTFIIIVPVNFLNTIQSPDFIKYLGLKKVICE